MYKFLCLFLIVSGVYGTNDLDSIISNSVQDASELKSKASEGEIPRGREGFGPGQQDWGYVDVREGAHMFWWLYYTTANVTAPNQRPLAIWLQGGPGASSTGYGNFEELGPLDLDLNPREHTWVKDMNVLFIDNPVGTGFSYVDNNKYLTRDNAQIALDLVEMLKQFYEKLPEFKTAELHIFAESYGGKMAAEFALELEKEIKLGKIESNFKSVAMIDSWVSPIDSVLSWAPFLLQFGLVDHPGHNVIMKGALDTKAAVDAGKWNEATNLWGNTEMLIMQQSQGVDFYNVMKKTSFSSTLKKIEMLKRDKSLAMYDTLVNYDISDTLLEELMTGPVSKTLAIPDHVEWGSQSGSTFSALNGDFMKPCTEVVELLLNQTSIDVIVITGNLDLIVATPGTVEWVDRLQWKDVDAYRRYKRSGVGVKNVLEGYQKHGGRFSMYWINRSGHMVPADNPAGMDYILRRVTNYDKK